MQRRTVAPGAVPQVREGGMTVANYILEGITRIPAAANDNRRPPSPAAPAMFWGHWMKQWKRTWARSPSLINGHSGIARQSSVYWGRGAIP